MRITKIKSIKKIPHEISYELTVEKNHNFIANNFIKHNCDGILVKTAKIGKELFFFTNGSFELNAPFEDSLVYDEPETRGATTYGDLLEYALKDYCTVNFDRQTGRFIATDGFVDSIPEYSTLMLELTSPRNKIICEYKETKLWWHGYRDKEGIEHDPKTLNFSLPFETPKLFNAANYDELKEILKAFKGNEQEGVVVVDYSTKGTPRTKIKCDSYLKLKFARDTSCNTALLFKAIINDEYDDLIASIPALLPKVESIKKEIEKFYDWFSKETKIVKEKFQSKRELAEWCKKNVNSNLFKYYMLMFEPDKLEKNLKFLSCKKKGYKEFLEILNECN